MTDEPANTSRDSQSEPGRPVLSYYKPPARRNWITGWDWTLLIVIIGTSVVWPRMLERTRPTPELGVVRLASFIIAVRAAIAVLRRDRSLWWLAYLLLFLGLPMLAYAIVEFWQTPAGQRIGIVMWHFWRDLF